MGVLRYVIWRCSGAGGRECTRWTAVPGTAMVPSYVLYCAGAQLRKIKVLPGQLVGYGLRACVFGHLLRLLGAARLFWVTVIA